MKAEKQVWVVLEAEGQKISLHTRALLKEGERIANEVSGALHAIFMAEILGVGTCLNDLIPSVCNRSREIRSLLGLPKEREFYSSLTLGFPKYKFHKSVPRRLAEVRYLN